MLEYTEVSESSVQELYDMLAMMRPDGSKTERAFCEKFLVPLGALADTFGNYYLRIGDDPKLMWSCHTDTVHRCGGSQKLARDNKYNICLSTKSASNCLGADDTAGVWLMCEMARAKVPGLYIFHRGEECGGKGSDWIVRNNPEAVKGLQFCVALDRRGYDSVITFQSGDRCCSDVFAKSMVDQLDLKFSLDQTGSFTDSKNYTDIIGECTNLSVGYFNQHGSTERLDLLFLIKLRDRLVQFDVNNLVSKRNPGEKESRWKSSYWDNGAWSRSRGLQSETATSNWYLKKYQGYKYIKGRCVACTYKEWEEWVTAVKLAQAEQDQFNVMLKSVRANATLVAELFLDWGFTADQLGDLLSAYGDVADANDDGYCRSCYRSKIYCQCQSDRGNSFLW